MHVTNSVTRHTFQRQWSQYVVLRIWYITKGKKKHQMPMSWLKISEHAHWKLKTIKYNILNKANLMDLIAATGLVILFKLDSNRLFFIPCDLEIWWMTSTNNNGPLFQYVKLCASLKSIGELKRELKSGNAQFDSKLAILFVPWDLEISWMTLENNRTPLLHYVRLCALFQSHGWIQTGVTVWTRNSGQNRWVFCLVWPWNLTNDLEKQ